MPTPKQIKCNNCQKLKNKNCFLVWDRVSGQLRLDAQHYCDRCRKVKKVVRQGHEQAGLGKAAGNG